jgi:hypothetical protein
VLCYAVLCCQQQEQKGRGSTSVSAAAAVAVPAWQQPQQQLGSPRTPSAGQLYGEFCLHRAMLCCAVFCAEVSTLPQHRQCCVQMLGSERVCGCVLTLDLCVEMCVYMSVEAGCVAGMGWVKGA